MNQALEPAPRVLMEEVREAKADQQREDTRSNDTKEQSAHIGLERHLTLRQRAFLQSDDAADLGAN